MNILTVVAGALVTGLGSALLPFINAEAYVGGSAALGAAALPLVVLAMAVGQTAGKAALFEAARRGTGRFSGRTKKVRTGSARVRATYARLSTLLAAPRTGVPLVLASAALGVPPLAVVSVAAGAAGHSRWAFMASCLVGRTARFAVIALALTRAAS